MPLEIYEANALFVTHW